MLKGVNKVKNVAPKPALAKANQETKPLNPLLEVAKAGFGATFFTLFTPSQHDALLLHLNTAIMARQLVVIALN